jgi:hypothetical protein
MIETGDVVEPTPGKLKRVAAKAAAQVQDSVAMRKGRRRDQDVDLLGSEPVILDDVAVRAQVERAKQRTPPIGRDMAGEVAERTGRAGVPFNHLGCVSGAVEGSGSIQACRHCIGLRVVVNQRPRCLRCARTEMPNGPATSTIAGVI